MPDAPFEVSIATSRMVVLARGKLETQRLRNEQGCERHIDVLPSRLNEYPVGTTSRRPTWNSRGRSSFFHQGGKRRFPKMTVPSTISNSSLI